MSLMVRHDDYKRQKMKSEQIMGCGNGTQVKDDPFLYRNHYPLPVRAMVGIFGCVLLALPYYLLIAPGWNHFSWLLIPYGLIGLVVGLAGLSFILSAVLGEARETRLDFAGQRLVQTSRDMLYRKKQESIPFRDLSILEIGQPDWATDDSVFTINPVRNNGDNLPAFGSFPSREEARKVTLLMGHIPNEDDSMARNWTKEELAALQVSMEQRAAGGSCGSRSCGC